MTTYWHGGAPGLEVGQRIRPAAGLVHLPMEYQLGEMYGSDPTRAHVTTDQKFALSFAAKVATPEGQTYGGSLYEVTPIGDLEPDPDFPPEAGAFTCKAATIVAVAQTGVRFSEELEIYSGQFARWDNGDLVYDSDGFGLPSPQMRELGITATDLRTLGKAPCGRLLHEFAAKFVVEHRRMDRLKELVQRQERGSAFGLGGPQ